MKGTCSTFSFLPRFLESCLITNMIFLKYVPNLLSLICLEFRIGESTVRGVCLRSLVHREPGRRRLGALGAPRVRIPQCFGTESTLENCPTCVAWHLPGCKRKRIKPWLVGSPTSSREINTGFPRLRNM